MKVKVVVMDSGVKTFEDDINKACAGKSVSEIKLSAFAGQFASAVALIITED